MKNPLRITFLLPHLKISGGIRVVLIYASLLAERGHHITICVRSSSPIRRFLGNLFRGTPSWFPEFHGAQVLRVATFTEYDLPDADVVIAGPAKTALDIAQLSPRKGKKVYFIQHDEGLYHVSREIADKSYRLPLQKIVVSTWLKDILRDTYGEGSLLLLNTIDRDQFHPVAQEKHDGVRILLLDHTYEWKGTKEGVAIVSELKKKYPEIRLIGFGARKEVSEYGFDEYYYNLPQEKLAWLYSNCDIFLCASWDEGFGLPSLEAMACGAAVATYDNGGSRDFAFHEKTALVAPRRDAKRLATELERLVNDSTLRAEIAKGGHEFVSTMPTWKEQTVELEKMLSA